jgi:hypothetical protein
VATSGTSLVNATSTAKDRFAVALRELREQAGNPTSSFLIARAYAMRGVKLSSSALSEWCRGRSIPAERSKLELLASILTSSDRAATPPGQVSRLLGLYDAALLEQQVARGARSMDTPVPSSESTSAPDDELKLLCARYGNVCAHPRCDKPLLGLRAGDDRFLGEIVHIVTVGIDSIRSEPAFPPSKIDTEPNQLLVCAYHDREINDRPGEWDSARLRQLRKDALGAHSIGWRQHLPKLMALHYANAVRLAHIALGQGQEVAFPGGAPDRSNMNVFYWVQSVLAALDNVELETRRLTKDFDLRTLRPGDLLVFDRQVRTLRTPTINATSDILTGNLDTDPLIYLARGGVRVVMPLDPDLLTTSSAYTDLATGQVQLAGLCLIKRRMSPIEPPAMKRPAKMRFLASPLLLGIAQWNARDPDLNERTIFEGRDPKTGEITWYGPWNSTHVAT